MEHWEEDCFDGCYWEDLEGYHHCCWIVLLLIAISSSCSHRHTGHRLVVYTIEVGLKDPKLPER